MLLQALCILLLVPAVLAALYYLGLAVLGLALRQRHQAQGARPSHHFAIVIPAHNEEAALAATLRACARLDYPPERRRVYVIADNCTDATAGVARACGATCLERSDPERRGKGWALEWGLPRVLADRPDAVVVLDADCTLDTHALRAFDRHLRDGQRVLQASNVASNPDATVTSYVACVANAIENDLYYAPKSRLGLAVLLRGTGMVFAREVLEAVPWTARSIVEDAEYSLRLYRARQTVRFVPEARVQSHFAEGGRQLAVQRRRWVGGNASFGRAHALRLMLEGLGTLRPRLCDLGWTLLVSTRSLLLLEMLLTLGVAALCTGVRPGTLSATLLLVAAGLPLVHGLVLGMGVLHLGLSRRRLGMLLGSPVVIVRMLWIALQALWAGPAPQWERTPR
jgi:glycosyltransferase involved in cell wall biosynthesis